MFKNQSQYNRTQKDLHTKRNGFFFFRIVSLYGSYCMVIFSLTSRGTKMRKNTRKHLHQKYMLYVHISATREGRCQERVSEGKKQDQLALHNGSSMECFFQVGCFFTFNLPIQFIPDSRMIHP